MSRRLLKTALAGAIAAAIAWGASAAASEGAGFYLETLPVASRIEAMGIQQTAADMGLQARVVRQARYGLDAEFSVRVEGFSERAEADRAAERLTAASGQGVAVFSEPASPDVAGSAEPPLDRDEQAPSPDEAQETPAPDEILHRAVRALGGREGGLTRLREIEAIHVRYERAIYGLDDTTLRVQHDWLARGESRRLALEILEGEGTDSLIVLSDDGAWAVVGGEAVPRDPARVAEVLGRYDPAQLLVWPLAFPSRVGSWPDATARAAVLDAQPCLTLGEAGGDVQLWVSPQGWRLLQARVRSEGVEIVYRFSDWRELDPRLVIPFRTEVLRDGERVETILVRELSLEPPLEADEFAIPGGQG